jgi:hypothetical protein
VSFGPDRVGATRGAGLYQLMDLLINLDEGSAQCYGVSPVDMAFVPVSLSGILRVDAAP